MLRRPAPSTAALFATLVVVAGCGTTPVDPEIKIVVTAVQISATATEFDLSATAQLAAAVFPPQAPQGITWSSQNEAIATISAAGVLEAVSPGTVDITAKSTAYPSVSDVVTIRVRECPAPRRVAVPVPSVDATWDNWIASPLCFDYVVANDITIGAVLTIEPGTIIGFEDGSRMTVRGGIVAVGTEDDPIRFTGTTAVRGSWDGLFLLNTVNPVNRIEHVTIEYGGAATFSGSVEPANLTLFQSQTALVAVTLRQSSAYGAFLSQGSSIVGGVADRLTSTKNALGPVLAYASVAHLVLVGDSTALTGNDRDVVTIRPDEVATTVQWKDSGVPVRVLQASSRYALEITGNLTLGPGLRVEFEEDMGVLVNEGGALTATGAVDNPIFLTGTSSVRGHWRGVQMSYAQVDLEYVVIEFGGRATTSGSLRPANLVLNVSGGPTQLRMRNSVLRESLNYGLFSWHPSVEIAEFSGNTLTRNALGPAYVAAHHVNDLPTSGTYTGNDIDWITVQLESAPIVGQDTWRDLGLPYHVIGGVALTLEVVATASLTFEPGVEVLFAPGVGLLVNGGSLTAEGTAQDTIRFSAAAGSWRGFNFFHARGSFDYVDIANAGSSSWSGVSVAASISVTSSGNASTVKIAPGVQSVGPPFGMAFSFGPSIGVGCLVPVYIPPPDVLSDHCRPPTGVASRAPR